MGCEIACCEVVGEVIERRDGWVGKKVGPGDRVVGVEFCV